MSFVTLITSNGSGESYKGIQPLYALKVEYQFKIDHYNFNILYVSPQ